ncbi:MAG: 5'-deoxynucleotidase [Clostridia bacterium]|nr:5'-deoxynucleotidase [Clostridia bacterium]
MAGFHFFAYMSRMKLIRRWSLMKSVYDEDIAQHTTQVAHIAHALAVIRNTYFGGNLDADRIAVMGLYHESSEVLTGDLPTPIKYYNPEIKKSYKDIEAVADEKLIRMLPEEMRDAYRQVLRPEPGSYEERLVKAADKLSAYTKCLEELRSGNKEFAKAEKTLKASVETFRDMEEVDYFCKHFLPAYSLTLDELE